MLRLIYPLRLRHSLYFRLRAGDWSWPQAPVGGFPLHFAPVRLPALLPTDISHRQIAHIGFYELELSRFIRALARKGGLFVDVGANVGYFTCLWAAINPTNVAYAFEPSPRNMEMLQQNLSTQNFGCRVKLFPFALGRETGVGNFHLGPPEQSGWGGISLSASSETLKVAIRRLDELIESDREIAALKVDTEGADAWVLEGAAGLLRAKRIQHVFCERNTSRMEALGIATDSLERLLKNAGYTVEYLDGSKRGEIHAYH